MCDGAHFSFHWNIDVIFIPSRVWSLKKECFTVYNMMALMLRYRGKKKSFIFLNMMFTMQCKCILQMSI